MPTGTVIRVTSGGGKGRRKKQHLIVVPGSIDFSKHDDDKPLYSHRVRYRHRVRMRRIRGQVWKARKTGRVYRIRDFPDRIRPGDTVPYTPTDRRAGNYWDAEYAGTIEPPKPEPQFSPLELQVLGFPKLPEELREGVCACLNSVIWDIECWGVRWEHDYNRQMTIIYLNQDPSNDPVTRHITPYVERRMEVLENRVAAIKAYKAISYAVRGFGNMHVSPNPLAYPPDTSSVNVARTDLIYLISRRIDKEAFERLKAWNKYQRRLKPKKT